MGYLALYRKYRPKTFEEVVDQEHITKTLINQIKSDKVGHAYLFCGSRGTGKTTTAKIFAKAINCTKSKNGSPCLKCESCNQADNNFDVLEIDAASNNGVDEIRELREQVKYPPTTGKYKVYIIDEVHMLSTSAFNALLKTLEEPPSYVVFILATTEVHKIPATILSRCMRFDFKLVSTDKIAKLIGEILKDSKIEYDEKAVQLIARAGEGSVRDALSLADMVIAYANNNLTYDNVVKIIGSIEKDKLFNIANALLEKNLGEVLLELDKVISSGKSALVLSKDLISYFRDLLVLLTIPNKASELVVVPKDILEKMKKQATEDNYITIIKAIEELSMVEQELRYSVQPKIVLETALIKTINVLSLEERVERIEKQLQGVNLEDKKKISENLKVSVKEIKEKVVTTNAETIYGELLKFARECNDMQLYSAIINIYTVKLQNGVFELVVKFSNVAQDFDFVANKNLQTFFKNKKLMYNVIVQKNIEDLLIEKLQSLIGDKLQIK